MFIKFFSAFFFLFATTSAYCRGVELIDQSNALSSDETRVLISHIKQAEQAYRTLIGKTEEVRIVVNPDSCFRTGYSFQNDSVQFCDVDTVNRFGIYSTDVIYHELFHYYFCHQRPELCTSAVLSDLNAVAIHEALADYFAYLMNPDSYFGEGFYLNRPYIRTYQNDGCFDLLKSSYHKAQTIFPFLKESSIESISRYMAKGNLSVQSLAEYGIVRGACFEQAFKLEFIPSIGEISSLNRYRIPSKGMRLSIVANPAFQEYFGDVNITVTRTDTTSPVFDIAISGGSIFIKTLTNRGYEKVYVNILKDKQILTQIPLYLTVKK